MSLSIHNLSSQLGLKFMYTYIFVCVHISVNIGYLFVYRNVHNFWRYYDFFFQGMNEKQQTTKTIQAGQ